MSKYFILSTSLNSNLLTAANGGYEFTFIMETAEDNNVYEILNGGDFLIAYDDSTGTITNYVIKKTNANMYVKILEITNGIDIGNFTHDEEEIIEINKDTYDKIIKEILKSQIDLLDLNDTEESVEIREYNGEPGTNELYYGVPGVGKSYTINERINGAPFERVVFHPDYSYSDFVGQIMPRLIDNGSDDKKLTYKFVEGPFTKALMNAEKNKGIMHYLVIEEINRGNAAAIFGDLFQLLDRDDNGRSDYSITNFDISQKVYGNPNEEIRIPSNLTLLATMNTSDQNVFTLDTAFQRRWNMHYIKNDINNAKHVNVNILNSNITWGNFVNVINDEIAEYSLEMASSEDKQLGAYFVSEADLKDVSFAEKALKYLWDDAFKLDRDKIFKDKFKSIGDLLGTYIDESNAGKDPIKAVMKDEIYKKMLNKTTDSSEDNEEVDYAVEE